MRVPVLQRERATILFLRKRFHYSINVLSQALNRSVSMIHRIIEFNRLIGNLSFLDLRRIPTAIKKIATARQQRQLAFFMEKWTLFIIGESDRPP